MLEARKISKHYGGVAALKSVDWKLEAGEVHALCGENGAGKSTLARIFCGITAPSSGEISLAGKPVTWGGPQEARNAGIGIILQELDLFGGLSIAENLAIGNAELEKHKWVSRSALNAAAAPLMLEVGLNFDPARRLDSLSVSQWQLVAIARVLALSAKVIFMDEPTSALTDDAVERLFGLIRRLREKGVAIVYVSHKMDEIFRICDRVSVLRDGEMIGTQRCQETTIDSVIRQMVGRSVSITRGSTTVAETGKPLLNFDAVRTRKLDGVSFQVRQGEILGIAGLVASGRSEVGRALFGLSPVISGQITLEDRPFKPALPGDAIARGVALIPEDRRSDGLVSSMSIRHNATLASLGKFSRASWINADAEAGAAKDALARCQTKLAHDELPVRALSGGNQQKVLIGKWLMTDPRLCFFDDPTRGIDIGAKDDIYRLLARLAADGMGILWVSSELPELLANAHRILVLHEGRAMGLLDPAAASQEDIMRLATGHPQLLS